MKTYIKDFVLTIIFLLTIVTYILLVNYVLEKVTECQIKLVQEYKGDK